MENKEIARVFYDIANLLELKEENPFKIRAYQNAARAMEGLNERAEELVRTQRLQTVPGIGKAIAEKIEEVLRTGQMKYYEELKAAFPSTLFELLRVPNLGPKKIKALHDQLGIKSLKELEEACKSNKLVDVRGFGKTTQNKILEGIKIAEAAQGSHLLGKVLPIARDILTFLQGCRDIEQVEIAGSVRRRKEIVGDLDFVASSKKPTAVAKYFTGLPFPGTVTASGDTKVSIRLHHPSLNVDLRIVKPAEFASALHHFTGSKEHNVAMRAIAKRMGYKINEYGLFKEGSEKSVPIATEADLYSFFKMDYVPPEMRENYGEIEAAQEHRIPKLVEFSDLQGLFHVHSVWSDGHDSLEDMIAAARDRGYKFVGISEHSKIASYAHGLDEMRLAMQSTEIDRLRKKYKEIKILKGIEVDILADGTLDFSDEVLSKLDFVIASVHSGFKMEEKEMTARICRALSNPHMDILGHATGRMLLGRKGYAVNLDEVLATAKKFKKCIEINCSPHRMELDWSHVKKAIEMGIPLSINPDAHRVHEFDWVPFGIGVARKGWASRENILNTRPWDKIKTQFEAAGK